MILGPFLRPGLLEIPDSIVPEEARVDSRDGYVLGLVTEVTTDLTTGKQVAIIDLETPARAAEKILREADNGR